MKPQQRPLAWLMSSALLSLAAMTGAQAEGTEAAPQADAPVAEPAQAPQPPQSPTGTQSRQWLRAQSTREQASRTRPTLSGPVMNAVHERYVRSFTSAPEPTSFHSRDSIGSN